MHHNRTQQRRRLVQLSYIEGFCFATMVGSAEAYALVYAIRSGLTGSQLGLLTQLPVLVGALSALLIPGFVSHRGLSRGTIEYIAEKSCEWLSERTPIVDQQTHGYQYPLPNWESELSCSGHDEIADWEPNVSAPIVDGFYLLHKVGLDQETGAFIGRYRLAPRELSFEAGKSGRR